MIPQKFPAYFQSVSISICNTEYCLGVFAKFMAKIFPILLIFPRYNPQNDKKKIIFHTKTQPIPIP